MHKYKYMNNISSLTEQTITLVGKAAQHRFCIELYRHYCVKKGICPNCKCFFSKLQMYLSKFENLFVQIARCICPNRKIYLSKLYWHYCVIPWLADLFLSVRDPRIRESEGRSLRRVNIFFTETFPQRSDTSDHASTSARTSYRMFF